jgi:hypothetical protein
VCCPLVCFIEEVNYNAFVTKTKKMLSSQWIRLDKFGHEIFKTRAKLLVLDSFFIWYDKIN